MRTNSRLPIANGIRSESTSALFLFLFVDVLAQVLEVEQDEVDADAVGQRVVVHEACHLEEHGHTRRAVVGTRDGLVALCRVRVLVRVRPAVPVRRVHHAAPRIRRERGDDVGPAEDDRRVARVGERYWHLGYARRERVEAGDEPLACGLVGGRAGHARPEGDLPNDIGVGAVLVEGGHGSGAADPPRGGGDEGDEDDGPEDERQARRSGSRGAAGGAAIGAGQIRGGERRAEGRHGPPPVVRLRPVSVLKLLLCHLEKLEVGEAVVQAADACSGRERLCEAPRLVEGRGVSAVPFL